MANPLINSTKVILPVDVAIAKTTYWREFMQETFQADVKQVPKAVYISRTDIEDMAKYCAADDSILGVRAYFTLENSFKETEANQVKFVMVLVKDVPGYFNGQDQLYIPAGVGMEALSPDGGDLDDSNVFDFTRPCPDCCDTTSPLYSNDNPPTKK